MTRIVWRNRPRRLSNHNRPLWHRLTPQLVTDIWRWAAWRAVCAGRPNDVDDFGQEAVLRVATRAATYRSARGASFRTWANWQTRTACHNYDRRTRGQVTTADPTYVVVNESGTVRIGENKKPIAHCGPSARWDHSIDMRTAINKLDLLDQKILLLRRAGYTHHEIAVLLGFKHRSTIQRREQNIYESLRNYCIPT